MKKFLSLFLSVTMLVTVLLPVQAFAQYDRELEKAIIRAKELIEIPEEFDDFQASVNKSNDNTFFYLRWNDSKNELGEVSVTIDSGGRVLNYNKYKFYTVWDESRKLPTISKDSGYEIATEFINKIASDIAENLSYEPTSTHLNVNSKFYDYNFTRIENDIPFYDNNVNVSVDNTTGEVTHYYCNWTNDLDFPDKADIIALEQAQETFKEELGFKLTYKLKYDYTDNSSTPYLVYTNVYNNKSIDAKTGEVIDVQNYILYSGMGVAKGSEAISRDQAAANIVLTPKEKETIEKVADLMTEVEAEKKARSILNVDNSLELKNISLYNIWNDKDEYIWNLSFSKEEKKNDRIEFYYVDISLNAITGEVISFYRSYPYKEDAPIKYDEEKCLQLSTDLIKSLQPLKFKEVELVDWQESAYRPLTEDEKPRNYYFNFIRKANNAYFLDNGINVQIDATTGIITSYNLNWYNGELPSTEEVIGNDAANNVMLEKIGLELKYVLDYSQQFAEKILPPIPTDRKPEVKLVYALNNKKPSNIDAYTGNLLDYSGEPYQEFGVAKYTDIENHYAEEQINLLAEYGIALPGEEFKPSELITQKEFLYLLQKSLNPYSIDRMPDTEKEEENFYQMLIKQGLIEKDEVNVQAHIARQDAVKFIIRALKYDKVAKVKGIFTVPFTDAEQISPELYGHVALAYGLGISKGNNGEFRPNNDVSRAEAAILIFNSLNIE